MDVDVSADEDFFSGGVHAFVQEDLDDLEYFSF